MSIDTNNTTHTPGPWVAQDGQVYAEATGKTLALVSYFDGEDATDQANARLLAAAPELLRIARMYADECDGAASEAELPVSDRMVVSVEDYRSAARWARSVISDVEGAQVFS